MLCPVATITFRQLFAIPMAGSPSVVHGRNPDRVRDRYVGVRLLGTRSDGLDAYLSVYSYTERERRDDDDEGDDPSVASSHGLSSDDHDDRDADPTAGCQGVQCGGAATGTAGRQRSSGSLVDGGTADLGRVPFCALFSVSGDLSCTISSQKTRYDLS